MRACQKRYHRRLGHRVSVANIDTGTVTLLSWRIIAPRAVPMAEYRYAGNRWNLIRHICATTGPPVPEPKHQ
jgi:hypothetical protein